MWDVMAFARLVRAQQGAWWCARRGAGMTQRHRGARGQVSTGAASLTMRPYGLPPGERPAICTSAASILASQKVMSALI
jgi:hypothetical protein